MKKIGYAFISLFLLTLPLCAQQNEQRAKELLEWVQSGKGDSVYIRLNDEAQRQTSPAMFNDVFRGLEAQLGVYQSQGEWKSETAAGTTVYYCDIQFEKYALRFLTAFDADGLANTIRFVPAPPSSAPVEKMNEDKIVEQPIEVVSRSFRLPGTLTLPKEKKQVPVVIWVHGSGPNDRDETVGPNKPFRDLAWGLAERGIASIRYDKRTNVYRDKYAENGEGTYDDETVDDALAAVELAGQFSMLDTTAIYVAGHSLGAMLAPRIAERSGALAGIIMLAGNARPFEDLLAEQAIYVASLGEKTPELEKELENIEKQMSNVKKLGTPSFDEAIPLPFGTPRSYWEFSHHYKQVDVAKRLSLPIFVLQGERDYQVTMTDFELWRSGLSGKPNVSFKSYPKLNHIFNEGSGAPNPFEYSEAGHVPGYVIDDIAEWIKEKK